jgi:Fe-S cluster biogenesis protein NfuA
LSAVTLENDQELLDRIEEALDRVRPAIQADGGDVELVGVEDTVASVRMVGACSGCPMSQMTLQMGIAYVIRENVPEITEVVAVPWDEDGI